MPSQSLCVPIRRRVRGTREGSFCDPIVTCSNSGWFEFGVGAFLSLLYEAGQQALVEWLTGELLAEADGILLSAAS